MLDRKVSYKRNKETGNTVFWGGEVEFFKDITQ